jgi:hypothetical protein
MAGRPQTRARRQAEAEAVAALADEPTDELSAHVELDGTATRSRRGQVSIEVEQAIECMTWLTDADRGLVALAKSYAGLIDGMRTVNVTQTLGLRLEQVLVRLGGAPVERAAIRDLGGQGAGKQGKLAGLRLAHSSGATGASAGRRKATRSA